MPCSIFSYFSVAFTAHGTFFLNRKGERARTAKFGPRSRAEIAAEFLSTHLFKKLSSKFAYIFDKI